MEKERRKLATEASADLLDPRLAAHDIKADANDLEATLAILAGIDRFHNPQTAARAVVSQHSQLATRDKDVAARIQTRYVAHAP